MENKINNDRLNKLGVKPVITVIKHSDKGQSSLTVSACHCCA